MRFMDYLFRSKSNSTASIAKERLQIIVSHQRSTDLRPDYLPLLENELINVIAKYVNVDHSQIKVELERSGNCSVLELNITLPDQGEIVADKPI